MVGLCIVFIWYPTVGHLPKVHFWLLTLYNNNNTYGYKCAVKNIFLRIKHLALNLYFVSVLNSIKYQRNAAFYFESSGSDGSPSFRFLRSCAVLGTFGVRWARASRTVAACHLSGWHHTEDLLQCQTLISSASSWLPRATMRSIVACSCSSSEYGTPFTSPGLFLLLGRDAFEVKWFSLFYYCLKWIVLLAFRTWVRDNNLMFWVSSENMISKCWQHLFPSHHYLKSCPVLTLTVVGYYVMVVRSLPNRCYSEVLWWQISLNTTSLLASKQHLDTAV